MSKGTMLIYRPNEWTPVVTLCSNVPSLDRLTALVEGPLEAVPEFDTITIDNVSHNCVAFANEYGKMKNLEYNEQATLHWDKACRAHGHHLFVKGMPLDILRGTVVVLFGEAKFMRAL